jgi:hypothetical protein
LPFQQGPQTLRDYFYPRTGKKDQEGNEERLQLPTYMKDVMSYHQHPVRTVINKLSPMLNMMSEMYQNQDFYGDQIRNGNDPAVQQFSNIASYIGSQFIPFSVRGATESRKREQTPAIQAMSYLGVTPAPRAEIRTPAQNMIAEFASARVPRGPVEKPDRPASEEPTTPEEILADKFKRLTADQAGQVMAVSNDQERAIWKPLYDMKLRNAENSARRERGLPPLPMTPLERFQSRMNRSRN